MDMASFQPADNLRSRTFLGLLVAQFLAAFNDQAIHASAMFFAINQNSLSKPRAIILMPILFYAPWAMFCTLAGYLADRYSKRTSLIIWKIAEIGITLIAVAGFWLGTKGYAIGPFVVLSTVFLMGTHSAFFVPAKYGAMPEILTPQMLSRGNGILESLSFLAVILGTVVGGVLSTVFKGQEYYIGVVLTVLAVIGAIASFLICRMPAADPERPFPRDLFGPLWANLGTLLGSRPLAFSVIGIAFFTFIVAFMRATVYLHGEVQSPQWTEAETSQIVGMVALGIGLGSPFVGFLSGGKVELGLVPVGAVGMVLATLVATVLLGWVPALVVCITLIGFFTGFYIVPLFTLLQQRAPKMSKGDLIATSNFINVTGAIAASLVVLMADFSAQMLKITPIVPQTDREAAELLEDPTYEAGQPVQIVVAGRKPITYHQGQRLFHRIDLPEDEGLIDPLREKLKAGDRVIESTYEIDTVRHHAFRREGEPQRVVYDQRPLPRLLFVGAAGMTLFTLLLLTLQMPDLFLRCALWARLRGRYRLNLYGADNLPQKGPVVLVSNASRLEAGFQILSATDRTCRFIMLLAAGERFPSPATRWIASVSTLAWLQEKESPAVDEAMSTKLAEVLSRGEVLGLPLPDPENDRGRAIFIDRAYAAATEQISAPVLPVCYEGGQPRADNSIHPVHIIFGKPMPAGVSLDEVRAAIRQLSIEFHEQRRNGTLVCAPLASAH
jgi:MFS family permease